MFLGHRVYISRQDHQQMTTHTNKGNCVKIIIYVEKMWRCMYIITMHFYICNNLSLLETTDEQSSRPMKIDVLFCCLVNGFLCKYATRVSRCDEMLFCPRFSVLSRGAHDFSIKYKQNATKRVKERA